MSRSVGNGAHHTQNAASGVRSLIEAAESGDGERVSHLLDENFFRYLLTDRGGLLRAFASLPEQWFAEHPRRRLTREIASATGPMQLLGDRVHREFVEWVSVQEHPSARDRLILRKLKMRRMLATGHYQDAAREAHDVERFIEEAAETAGFDDVLPIVLLRAGQARLHVGDLDGASAAFARAHRWAGSRETHPADRYIRSHLALVDALHGDFNLAKAWFLPDDQDEHADEDGLAYQLHTAELLIRALISVCSDTRDEAEAALRHVDDKGSDSDLWWVGAHARALHDLQWGEPRSGAARLEQALRNLRWASGPELMAGQLLRADLASLYQMANELEAAAQVLKTPELTRAHVLVRAADARQKLLTGRPQEAVAAIATQDAGGGGGLAPLTSVLHAVIEHAESGGATERAIARAADHIRSSGAMFAVQETVEPTRERILRHLDVPYSPPRSQYPYRAVISAALSQRERQVLAALREHDSVAAIATRLHLSVNTVKTYKRSLYRKLGVRTRAEALEFSIPQGD